MAGIGYHIFPSDLADNPEYGHAMVFTAYEPRFSSGFGAIREQFWMYVPGGGENNLVWAQGHEYNPDVKMSRIGTGAVAGGLGAALGIAAPVLESIGQLAGGVFRTGINPYVEVLYTGTKLRGFRFSVPFAPQSEEDSKILHGTGWGTGLLNRFRYHGAPQFFGPANALFTSPSEWSIEFYYKKGRQAASWVKNESLPRIGKCVLTRADIDYTPDTEFSTFENGEPVTARLTLSFIEMEIIDKTKIDQGF